MLKEIVLLRKPSGAGADWSGLFRAACQRAVEGTARHACVRRELLNLPIISVDPRAVGATADYDAVIETWLNDSVSAADWSAMPRTIFAQVNPGALDLADVARSTALLVEEVVVGEPRSSGYKIISFIWRGPTLPGNSFYEYWKNQHGPLLKGTEDFWRHLRGYVQNHPVAPPRPLGNGTTEQYDGVTQLWFDDDSAAVRAFNEPQYLAVIRADERVLRSGPPHRLAAQEHLLYSRETA